MAAVGMVAVVLCWSSVAWTRAISETSTTSGPNTLAAQFNGIEIIQNRNWHFSDISRTAREPFSILDESLVAAIPAAEDVDDHLDSFRIFSIAVGGVGPSSDLIKQLPISAMAQSLASSDDGHLAFPVDVPSNFDDRSTRFDFSRYPGAISSIHDGRHVGIVDGTPVPEPAVVGGLLTLALLAFITWRKRYG